MTFFRKTLIFISHHLGKTLSEQHWFTALKTWLLGKKNMKVFIAFVFPMISGGREPRGCWFSFRWGRWLGSSKISSESPHLLTFTHPKQIGSFKFRGPQPSEKNHQPLLGCGDLRDVSSTVPWNFLTSTWNFPGKSDPINSRTQMVVI